MLRLLRHPDRLFDRTWRPRYPLRPRLSALRRWGTRILLVVLLAIIGGYVYFTDSDRIRALAANALTHMLGGKVAIQHAELSVFEGLRLDGVSLSVANAQGTPSTLFSAKTFLVYFNPAELLIGRLKITQIIAIEPTVNLAEDSATHQWNFQLLHQQAAATARPGSGFRMEYFPELPEVILRNAQVRYLEVHNNQIEPIGWFGLEVHFAPSPQRDRYSFSVQSRGVQALGPQASGEFALATQTLRAQLQNLAFGPDVKAMMPADARTWLEEHGLEGKIDHVAIAYTLPAGPRPATFNVGMTVKDVELTINPDEWRSRRQIANQHWLQDHVTLALAHHWIGPGLAAQLRDLGTPLPLHLHQVSGDFAFDQDSFTIRKLAGRIENNWLNVAGRMQGYDADAPFTLDVASSAPDQLEIPPWSPRFVGSLPDAVRDICDQFKPRGTCGLRLRLDRAAPGGPIGVDGRLDILNGGLTFEDFPYPLRNVTGAITVGKAADGKQYIHILDVAGYGITGTANANAKVAVNCDQLGPLDRVAGGTIVITGENVACDKPLRRAMPPDVNAALGLFDPQGRGEFPQFQANFRTTLQRTPDTKRWDFQVSLDIHDGFGKLVSFPYPLEKLHGQVVVHDGYLDVHHLQMEKNGMSADIDGQVVWENNPNGSPAAKRILGPNLNIIAHQVGVDDGLLGALPPPTARWLQQIGAAARLEVNAKVVPGEMAINDAQGIAAPAKPRQDVNYLVDVTLADGTIHPGSSALVLDQLAGQLRITPDAIKCSQMTACRDQTEITAAGDLDVSTAQPRLHLVANAKNLAMDEGLRAALSDSARDGWDAMHPQGTLDAALKLDATLNAGNSATPPPPADYVLTLTPRDLAITPEPLPYRLEKLSGAVTLSPGLVRVEKLAGSHGQGTVMYDGIGHVDGTGKWELGIHGHNLDADDELLHGVPDVVADVLKQTKLQGKLDIDIAPLVYQPTTRPTASTHGDLPDVAVATQITLHGNTLEAGVPLRDVNGTIDLAAVMRAGQLASLKGKINLPKLQAASRPTAGVSADLLKAVDDPAYHVANLQAAMADGNLTGDITMTYPDAGPSHYQITLFCHDMDVHQILQDQDEKVHGRLTASLTLGGPWNDVKNRRGHGDVRVNGEEMSNVPMMMGTRWINLGVPSAFTTATIRYNVDGQTVNIENLELTGKDVNMSGTGTLDFATKHVDLLLVTNTFSFLGKVFNDVSHELMHIHVRGQIQEPKVSVGSFETVTTTVDDVVKKEEKK